MFDGTIYLSVVILNLFQDLGQASLGLNTIK